MLVADGFDHVAYEDDLLEAVVDLEQRGFSCATFSGVGSWYADWSGRRWSSTTWSTCSCDLRSPLRMRSSPLITPYRRGGSSPRVRTLFMKNYE